MEPPARRGGYALRSRPVDARDRCDDRCRHHYAEQSPHRAIAVKSNVSQQAGGERSACSRRLRDHREPSSKAWHSTVSKGAARGEAKRALWPALAAPSGQVSPKFDVPTPWAAAQSDRSEATPLGSQHDTVNQSRSARADDASPLRPHGPEAARAAHIRERARLAACATGPGGRLLPTVRRA